jgi:hypothetical protein
MTKRLGEVIDWILENETVEALLPAIMGGLGVIYGLMIGHSR